MTAEEGPSHAMPASSTARASSEFSEKETVAGMDGVGTGFNRDSGFSPLRYVEAASSAGESLVRFAGVGRLCPDRHVSGDGGNAHVGGGAAGAQGDPPRFATRFG